MRTIKEEHGRLAPGPVRAQGQPQRSTESTEIHRWKRQCYRDLHSTSVDLCVLCGDSVLQTTQSGVDSGVAAIQLPS